MSIFHFRTFDVDDHGCGMKICSDSVLLAAWFLRDYPNAASVLDVGTGSGVLALLAAQICQEARITAVELDAGAYRAAVENFSKSTYAPRLKAVQCDIADFKPDFPPEIIISNPPYFTNGERSADKSRRTARHQDGLTYSTLLSLPLSATGHLGMVTPADYYDDIIFEAEMRHRRLRRLCRVSTAAGKSPTRLLWDFSPSDGDFIDDNLNLRDSDGLYSAEYRRLVEPYYQKLPLR